MFRGHCPFANRFPLTISQHLLFTSGEFTTALARKLGLVIPQLLTAVGMPLSNNPSSARKVGDALGHAYTTTETGAKGDHVRALHGSVLAYLFGDLKAAGIPFRGGPGKSTKKKFSHCMSQNLTDRDYLNLQGIFPVIGGAVHRSVVAERTRAIFSHR